MTQPAHQDLGTSWLRSFRVWSVSGGAAPAWTVGLWRAARWLPAGLLLPVVLGILPSVITDPDASNRLVTLGSAIARLARENAPWLGPIAVVLAAFYLYLAWAQRRVRQRRDLLSLLKPMRGAAKGRLLTVSELEADDLLPARRRRDPTPAFLGRTVKEFRAPDSPPADGVERIVEAWANDRGVAVLGAAGMGKTRLVFEAVKRLPPDTLVLVPDQKPAPDDLQARLAYLKGRKTAVIFDDLNYYAESSNPPAFVQAVSHATGRTPPRIAATCTLSTLPSVTSDTRAQLKDYFASLAKLELQRMSGEQMQELSSATGEKLVGDHGGNPGMLLFDLDSLRVDLANLSPSEHEVLEAAFALYANGVVEISADLVRESTNEIFHRDLGPPDAREALAKLELLSLLRQLDPVQPEEAFVLALLDVDEARRRGESIERVAKRLRNPQALADLATGRHYRGEHDAAARAASLAAELWRQAPLIDLEKAAHALHNVGVARSAARRPVPEIESAYREAAETGRAAGTAEGLVRAAESLFNLGILLGLARRPVPEIESAYREAAEAGRAARTSRGLVRAAHALYNLGNALVRAERRLPEIESAYREAAAAGRAANSAEGLGKAAQALYKLGVALTSAEAPLPEIESAYQEAVEAGRKANTPRGLVQAAKALGYLGTARLGAGRPVPEIEAAFREAVQTGRDAGAKAGEGVARAAEEALSRLRSENS